MAVRVKRQAVDPELVKIDALQRLIAEGHPKVVLEMGGSEAEAERAPPEAERLAKAVCDQLRAEYQARGARH